MSYGISITGPNSQFVVDSTLAGASHLSIVSGPHTSSLGTAYSGAYTDFQAGDLVFAKPADGSGKIFADFSTGTLKISGRNTTYHGEDQTYFIVRPAQNSGHSLNQNGSNYGLRILQLGHVSSISITDGGSGYSSVPAVTIANPTKGITATGTATISSGAVTGITVTQKGTGYATPPAITIAGPGGGGSTATASAVLANDLMYDSRQTAKNIDIKAVKGGIQCVGGGTGTSGQDTEATNIIYGSKTSDTYACMNPSHTYFNTNMGTNTEAVRGFDFEGNNVRYVGWARVVVSGSGYGFAQTLPIRNIAELIVGDLVT